MMGAQRGLMRINVKDGHNANTLIKGHKQIKMGLNDPVWTPN